MRRYCFNFNCNIILLLLADVLSTLLLLKAFLVLLLVPLGQGKSTPEPTTTEPIIIVHTPPPATGNFNQLIIIMIKYLSSKFHNASYGIRSRFYE